MLRTGGDALLCDLAETYGVLEPRSLGAAHLAALACGLPEDARVYRQAAGGARVKTDTLLRAHIADLLGVLVWHLCCPPDTPRPESLLAQLLGEKTGGEDGGFDTAEEFEAARRAILEEVE